MSRMRAWFSVVAVLGASVLLACGVGDATEPEGDEASSAAKVAPGPKGFVVPSLTADEEATQLARYGFVDPDLVVPHNLLRDALLYFSVNEERIPNKSYVVIVDFARPSGIQRFFLIDMQTGRVTPRMVAHGEGSEDGHGNSSRFSNVDGSHQSSLGFVLTAEVYRGANGRSLRLDGLSKTNSMLRSRAVVLHGAAYVKETACRQGTSWGCFALDTTIKDSTIDMLKDGALMYAGLGDGTAPAPEAARAAAAVCPDPCLSGGCQK